MTDLVDVVDLLNLLFLAELLHCAVVSRGQRLAHDGVAVAKFEGIEARAREEL